MKYNNRLFPHPVLGIGDDVSGEFTSDLIYRSDKDFITLSLTFKLVDPYLQVLINENKACFLIQVYCKGTMFREVYKSKSSLPEPISISSLKLNGEVEVHFFICALTSISNYFSKNFHPEYKATTFSIESSDILAYGGKAKFVANKSPEELKSISSLIRIKNSQKKDHPMRNEYEGEKIEILLCEEDYNNYQLVLKNRLFHTLLHSSIVMPALVEALYFVEKAEAKDLEERRWFKALKEIKANSKTPDCFQIAQNILDQPTERTFNTIITLMEEVDL